MLLRRRRSAEELEKVMDAQNKFEEEVDEVKAMLRKSNRDFKDTQKDFDDELEKLKDRQSDYEVEVDEHLQSYEAMLQRRSSRGLPSFQEGALSFIDDWFTLHNLATISELEQKVDNLKFEMKAQFATLHLHADI